jgi:hypothetical protein
LVTARWCTRTTPIRCSRNRCPTTTCRSTASCLRFTDNETNHARLFGGTNASPFVKDGIGEFVVHGRADAVNPAGVGTKVAPHQTVEVAGGACVVLRLRLATRQPDAAADAFADFDAVFDDRIAEADAFYAGIVPAAVAADADRMNVLRQALAGMLWTKQYFYYDLDLWLEEHGAGAQLPPRERRAVRNRDWSHMFNDDIISMPDKWEYPWYAAWDLAFHMIPLGMVDPDFAKQQLDLMLRNDYLHPNGQLPAYEWNFGDVNPPVHAWATYQLYVMDRERRGGGGDVEFLKYAFSKLLVNFTWWVNRKDRAGANVFEGGFLGLDNIGVFDRSAPLPTGGYLEQADGTAWMAFFSQQMLRIAVELALHEPLYEEFVEKFFQHTLYIAAAHGPHGRAFGRDVGRGRRLLLRRAAPARRRRDQAQGALDRRPAAAGGHGGVRGGHRRQAAALHRARARLCPPPPRARRQRAPAEPARRRRAAHAGHRRRGQAAPHPGAHARRERVLQPLRHPLAVAPPPRAAVRVPPRRPGLPRGLRAGGFRLGHVRRQLQLARAGVDADQLPALHHAAAAVCLLRRGFQGRMPDRLGAADDAARGGEGAG